MKTRIRSLNGNCDVAQQNGMTTSLEKMFAGAGTIAASHRALVVVTDAVPRGLCQQTLEAQGFAVTLAETGVAAVLAARKDPPELIVIDVELPDGPGLEAISWLRCNPALSAAPVILVSASPDDSAYEGSHGIDAVLRKPMSAAAIAGMVRKLFGRGAIKARRRRCGPNIP